VLRDEGVSYQYLEELKELESLTVNPDNIDNEAIYYWDPRLEEELIKSGAECFNVVSRKQEM